MKSSVLLDCDTHFTDHHRQQWAGIGHEIELSEFPELIEHDGQQRLRLGELVFPRPSGPGQGNPRGLGHLIGPGEEADRREFMAEHGIAAAILQPGFVGLSFQAIPDPISRMSLARAYNLLASRCCAASGLDLRWAILLSVEDPADSAAEVERHHDDPNVVGAVIRPTARTPAVRLTDSSLTPLLQTLADRELTLFVHGGTGCYQWSPLANAYANYTLTHAFGHMGEHMIALTDLLTRPDGIPGKLRIIMLESGTSWIPGLLERLALHHRRLSSGLPSPMDAFRAHVAIAPDPDERYADWACAELGTGNMVFGSDYPHWDTVSADHWLKTFGNLCPVDTLRVNTANFVPRLTDGRTS